MTFPKKKMVKLKDFSSKKKSSILLIGFFHNKIPLFSFCKKITIKLLKILHFSEGLSINEKIGNFLWKISIKVCVCLNKFLQNIGLTSFGLPVKTEENFQKSR
jgi:hypothetical protein